MMKSWALAARAAASSSACGGVGLAEAQVLGHRAVEQVGVLGHDGDLAAEHVERQLAQVVAAEAGRGPPAGSKKRSSSQTSVDLPAPLGPTTPSVSPAGEREDDVRQRGGPPPV